MKTPAPRTPADRDRAVARLRTLTIGSGLAGVLAVGGFGVLAARTYDGTSNGITTAALIPDSSTTATTATTATATSATMPPLTATATSTPATVQGTATPTTTTGTAHAATGSS